MITLTKILCLLCAISNRILIEQAILKPWELVGEINWFFSGQNNQKLKPKFSSAIALEAQLMFRILHATNMVLTLVKMVEPVWLMDLPQVDSNVHVNLITQVKNVR